MLGEDFWKVNYLYFKLFFFIYKWEIFVYKERLILGFMIIKLFNMYIFLIIWKVLWEYFSI